MVFPHKSLCELEPELLVWLPCSSGIVRVEDICVCNSNLKEKPKELTVKLVAFQPHMVVLSELVIFVDPSHIHVV